MTKPITSVAAMMLYEQGAFELTDPISRWLPEFAAPRVYTGGPATNPSTVPATEPIRVWHLLTHTAGLTYAFHHIHVTDEIYRLAGFDLASPHGLDLAGCVNAWAGLPLAFEPGPSGSTRSRPTFSDVWSSSGPASHSTSSCRANIFDPLQMTDTGFWVAPDEQNRLAALYAMAPGLPEKIRYDALGEPYKHPPKWLSGGGGLVSTSQRLHPVLPDAAAGRRARRRAAALPAHRAVHEPQPPAWRSRPGHLRSPAVVGDAGTTASASAWDSPSPTTRSLRRC